MTRYRSNAFWHFKDVGEWLTNTSREVMSMEVVSITSHGNSGDYMILVVVKFEVNE